MASEDTANVYTIWGLDQAPYGPVELPTLVSWVKEERVIADTWIFVHSTNSWEKASRVLELQMFFKARQPLPGAAAAPTGTLTPGALRRIKILGSLSDEQLVRLMQVMKLQQVPQWTQLVKQGEHGDAMYLVLGGELRVRLLVDQKETILTTLGVGEFFGEISLFDQGPRSADVVANADSMLLRISAEEFEELVETAPDVAAPFLFAIAKTLTARIRADNKRYRDSISFSRASH